MKECTLEKMKGYIERNERQIAMMTAQLQVPRTAGAGSKTTGLWVALGSLAVAHPDMAPLALWQAQAREIEELRMAMRRLSTTPNGTAASSGSADVPADLVGMMAVTNGGGHEWRRSRMVAVTNGGGHEMVAVTKWRRSRNGG